MMYISTRGNAKAVSSAQAIVNGIAPDGGLYVPQYFPAIDTRAIQDMVGLRYHEVAQKILSLYLSDFSEQEIKNITAAAYSTNFETDEIAPVISLDKKESVLELYHGPTIAFKDMALQILPHLMSASIKKTGETRTVLILVATSGDTGKAALEGFKDIEKTAIAVFYPKEGVSQAQKLQMMTQEGKNVYVCAVDGNFDDAQTGVKRIFADAEINQTLAQKGFILSSANSINWGRLVPQIAYYFFAYVQLLTNGMPMGEQVNFAVPTGNFGNILAGYYAKRMGLPIGKLVCASNSNNVLTDFFKDGAYNRKRKFFKTASPSMDILISSNLERLLFEITERDGAQVSQCMDALKKSGEYKIAKAQLAAAEADFYAQWCDEGQTFATIKQCFGEKRYLMDTHTAVAQRVYEQYKVHDDARTVVVSTASPYKFSRDVLEAILPGATQGLDEFQTAQKLCDSTHMPIPKAISSLQGKPLLHNDVCSVQDMAQSVLDKAAVWAKRLQ